ncbi:MAG TPA: aminotransferase class V-fold PLP-dependent enzyme, partial [Gemmatimonadaceae bacterium]|nr:aminotransferase class V-fold PLP-dependent enzyme [Gemmatimonadaceae bacterium]
ASMTDRRAFMSSMMRAGVALPTLRASAFATLFRAEDLVRGKSAVTAAEDEAYWSQIQMAFDDDRTLVNLNNGGVSPAPTHVIDLMIRDIRFSNQIPVDHMWQVLEPRAETVRRDLARMFGCDPEEMAIVRNASEANETMIFGLDLKRGDEVIVTNQNYPRMITSWQQRERREGIVLKQVSFKVPPPSDDYIVDQFRAAITPRTRVIEVTHITNLTGQILPVRKIVQMAREQGIEVFVDGAHAFAHFPFTRDELDADYYGTSLHKWLHAPIGTGFLYVRRNRIKSLWPLMGAAATQDDNIRKYEEIGTHPAANHNAIALAVAFNRGIGMERKAARLRYLRDRWAKRLLAESARFNVLTPLDDRQSCAIALVNIEGIDTPKLQQWLWHKHKVMTVAIVHPEFHGLRVTPSVYSTLDEVDLFAELMIKASRQGIAV